MLFINMPTLLPLALLKWVAPHVQYFSLVTHANFLQTKDKLQNKNLQPKLTVLPPYLLWFSYVQESKSALLFWCFQINLSYTSPIPQSVPSDWIFLITEAKKNISLWPLVWSFSSRTDGTSVPQRRAAQGSGVSPSVTQQRCQGRTLGVRTERGMETLLFGFLI